MSLLSKGVTAIGSSIVSGVKSLASGVANIFTGGSKPTTGPIGNYAMSTNKVNTAPAPVPVSRYLPAANQAPKTGPVGNFAMSTGQVNRPVTVNISTPRVTPTVTASAISRAVSSSSTTARRGGGR
jgi:hypothetical protein